MQEDNPWTSTEVLHKYSCLLIMNYLINLSPYAIGTLMMPSLHMKKTKEKRSTS